MGSHTRSIPRVLGAVATAGLVALGASRPASARDIATLRVQAQKVADQVTTLERRLAPLGAERARLEATIEDASREIGALELARREAEQVYQDALDDYVARAIELYKSGSAPALDLLLSARTMSEAFTIAEATGTYGEAASQTLHDLLDVGVEAERAQERIDARKQEMLVSRAEVEEIAGEIEAALVQRRAKLHVLNTRIAALERMARLDAAQAAQPSVALINLLAPSGPSSGLPEGFVSTGVTFEGIASWYGPGFEGNPTANGDIFDPDLYTAASLDLPLGTWLYVEHEGRGVVVLVNDRGPYIEGRILDLSQAAAEAIGITGLGWIRAEILLEV